MTPGATPRRDAGPGPGSALLRPGDRIAVVAPAGPAPLDDLERGIAFLERRGYEVARGAHLSGRRAYLAGTDEERASDLNAAIRDRAVQLVWCARGGYGTPRLLDRVDTRALRRDPKPLLGYSDETALQEVWRRAGAPILYGPHVVELADRRAWHARSLEDALLGRAITVPIGRRGVVREGRAQGPILGGCLSLLVGLAGTPWEPPLDGAILFWEDLNEQPFRIDRMLTHLRNAGWLSRLAGMVVGRLPGGRALDPRLHRSVRDILLDRLEGTRYPVAFDLPAGHVPGKWTLPLGGPARLDTRAGRLTIAPARAPVPAAARFSAR
ncbi:MAG TPA: LD-carboxypeptidase [Candidatus Polarisedimenticolia bacterium]|nr:LD-carboxypeptidase [Candidatus Polarisedimenticolia bacterium]